MSSYLVTGTSRGIGLELARQLIEEPETKVSKVFAVTRDKKSKALNDLIESSKGRLINIVIPNITDPKSVQQGVVEVEKALQGKGLDVLVNNAGVMPYTPGGSAAVPPETLLDTLNVNVVSVHIVTSAFMPLLKKGHEKKVINISTTLGSIARVKNYIFAPVQCYKVSKAALNMLNAQYALDYEKEGFTFLLISPGWLRTDLGSEHADLPVDVGVREVKRIMFEADTSKNGKFQNILVPGWENAEGPNQYDGGYPEW